jgi:hypothetical protein
MSSRTIKGQRDQAFVCWILSLCIAGAVFFSVFGRQERIAIEEVRNAVAIHEGLLQESDRILQQNKSALAVVSASLDTLERRHGR